MERVPGAASGFIGYFTGAELTAGKAAKDAHDSAVKLGELIDKHIADTERYSAAAAALREQATQAVRTGDRGRAKVHLVKAKKYEAFVNKIASIVSNLEAQKMALEQGITDTEIFRAQVAGAKALRKHIRRVGGVEGINEFAEEYRQIQQDGEEISDALSQSVAAHGSDATDGDDEIESELAALMEQASLRDA